jgi:cobalt-zinc-cadmium efflux system outer membrane protein
LPAAPFTLAAHLEPVQPEPVPAPPAATPTPDGGGTTLDELERLAEERHPKLLAAAQEIEAAHGRTWQAGRMPNPSLGAASPQLAGSESQYNVFVSQEIPTGGKLRLNQAAAAEEIDQAELSLSRARYDVLTSVRRHFYAALVAQSRVEALQQQVAMIGRSVQLARMRFEVEEKNNKTHVMLLEVDLHKAEVALAGAQADLEARRRQLAAAIGIPDYPLAKLAGNLDAELSLGDLTGLPQRVASSHTQAAIAATEIRRRQLLVERAYAEPKPTFNVQGGYQRQVGPPQDQGILQLTMSVPLWDRNYGGIQAAEAQAMKAQADLQRIEMELASQAATALGRYQAAQQRAASPRQDPAADGKEGVDLATRLYAQGKRNSDAAQHPAGVSRRRRSTDAQAALWEAVVEIADLLQLERFP